MIISSQDVVKRMSSDRPILEKEEKEEVLLKIHSAPSF